MSARAYSVCVCVRVCARAAAISIYMSDDLLSGTVTALLERVKKGDLKPDLLRIYIQALGHIRYGTGSKALPCTVFMDAHELCALRRADHVEVWPASRGAHSSANPRRMSSPKHHSAPALV